MNINLSTRYIAYTYLAYLQHIGINFTEIAAKVVQPYNLYNFIIMIYLCLYHSLLQHLLTRTLTARQKLFSGNLGIA